MALRSSPQTKNGRSQSLKSAKRVERSARGLGMCDMCLLGLCPNPCSSGSAIAQGLPARSPLAPDGAPLISTNEKRAFSVFEKRKARRAKLEGFGDVRYVSTGALPQPLPLRSAIAHGLPARSPLAPDGAPPISKTKNGRSQSLKSAKRVERSSRGLGMCDMCLLGLCPNPCRYDRLSRMAYPLDLR